MSECQVCELCLESMGISPNIAHMIVGRFNRDAATIQILRMRISQLTKTPPHVHPHKRKSHCDCKQRQCNPQHR